MKALGTITDPVFKQKPKYNAFERTFLNMILDERDLPFIKLSILLTFTLIPSAILLYSGLLTGWMFWTWAFAHLALGMGLGMGPYILMLHNTSHRKFFKPGFQFLNYYIPWVLGPFVGQSPETYFGHHIGMHHAENNLEEDRSSTMRYQRDKFTHFLHYYGSFMFTGIIHVADYFIRKKRYKFVRMVIRGELLFILLCVGLSFVSFNATLFVFILPIVIARFGMMSGNWAQHAFIHQDKPGDSWLNSITCINTPYNRKCFNDGYHIGHHLSPHRHWTDMPADFLKNLDKYADHQTIVFDGVDYMQVWFFLMRKDYKTLAKHFVNINDQYKSEEEVIELLRSRTKQFTKEQRLATLKAMQPHQH